MKARTKVANPTGKRKAQALVIAILVLGVLLILGIAFAAIVSRSINQTGVSARRTLASDLAGAGIKYAHSQLLHSASGADWRPEATPPTGIAGGLTKDPDALYLREGTGFPVEIDPVGRPGFTVTDLGGPDYLGAYSRIGFDKGRALVRVRYAPNAYDQFSAATGALRQTGKARGYTVIESVGRAGALDDQGRVDPSRLLATAVQVSGFADGNDLRNKLGGIKAADANVPDSRVMIGFASVGMLETPVYITDIYKTNRPAEIGFPTAGAGGLFTDNTGVGNTYEGVEVATGRLLGANASGAANIPVSNAQWDQLPGAGGLYSNTAIEVHGAVTAFVNTGLGESWIVNGGVRPANSSSSLTFQAFDLDASTATPQWRAWAVANGNPFNSPVAFNAAQLNSDNPQFNTGGGLLQDGRSGEDTNGYNRQTKRKEAPSITATDPQSGLNRYLELTQRTGVANPNGTFSGEFGHGEGVYVDSNERGNRRGSDQARGFDPQKSLPNDWLNPNNAASQGWQGPYYIPNAPHVRFLPDGFEIRRDTRSASAFWQDPTGASTGNTYCRFWVRRVAGENYIADSVANPGFDPTVPANFVNQGRIFNGVLMFAGDVRVRGVIPTDQQISVVSMGTVYVEGSLTKGIVDPWSGALLTRPSASVIALLAKDYVTVNTTMFFGPKAGESPRPKSTNPLPNTPNPIELDASTEITLNTEFLLNPVGNDPSAWVPFASGYVSADGTGPLASQVILAVSADDNGPSFLGMDVTANTYNLASATGAYLWQTQLLGQTVNGAAATYPLPTPLTIPEYGLTDPTVNAYPKFESWAMPVFDPAAGWNPYTAVERRLRAVPLNSTGVYDLAMQDTTDFHLRLNPIGSQPSKNVLVARSAVTPADVRIEAVMYAQNGSFFVIPGQWFNTNPDDLRSSFEQNYTPGNAADDLNTAALDYGGGANLLLAQQRRYERFGNSPETPFYAEPLAVRITISGSIAENMPAPMSMQSEWLKKWGWMPRRLGGTGRALPAQHVPGGILAAGQLTVPNLNLAFDPVLTTAAVPANSTPTSPLLAVRTTADGRLLPPAPRLPVSPTLAYFGDINP